MLRLHQIYKMKIKYYFYLNKIFKSFLKKLLKNRKVYNI